MVLCGLILLCSGHLIFDGLCRWNVLLVNRFADGLSNALANALANGLADGFHSPQETHKNLLIFSTVVILNSTARLYSSTQRYNSHFQPPEPATTQCYPPQSSFFPLFALPYKEDEEYGKKSKEAIFAASRFFFLLFALSTLQNFSLNFASALRRPSQHQR